MGKHTLREPAQAKFTSAFHKSRFIWTSTGKIPQARMSPERRRTLCASLRDRNACQHFTEPLYTETTGKGGETRASTLIKHRPLHLRQEPLSVIQCGYTVWGKNPLEISSSSSKCFRRSAADSSANGSLSNATRSPNVGGLT